MHGGDAPVIKAASSVCLAVMINCDVKKCAMLRTYKGIDYILHVFSYSQNDKGSWSLETLQQR